MFSVSKFALVLLFVTVVYSSSVRKREVQENILSNSNSDGKDEDNKVTITGVSDRVKSIIQSFTKDVLMRISAVATRVANSDKKSKMSSTELTALMRVLLLQDLLKNAGDGTKDEEINISEFHVSK